MAYPHARHHSTSFFLRRALLVSAALLISGCHSCLTAKPPQSQGSEQGQSLVGERLFDYIPKNCDKELGTIPFLFVHSLQSEQKIHDMNVKDLLHHSALSSASSSCPPGPFMVDGSSALDVEEKKWVVNNNPDFFLWYSQDDIKLFDFYLTNQSGFPIKSQSVKLNQENDSLLVLLPKAPLELGKTYYLYLVEKNDTDKKTWVQPFVLAKKQ